MKMKDIHKATDSTPLSHELAGQAVDSGIKSLFGLLKGRGKPKEMKAWLSVLNEINDSLDYFEDRLDAIEKQLQVIAKYTAKKLGVEDE